MSNQSNILKDGVQFKDGINGWSGCYLGTSSHLQAKRQGAV